MTLDNKRGMLKTGVVSILHWCVCAHVYEGTARWG